MWREERMRRPIQNGVLNELNDTLRFDEQKTIEFDGEQSVAIEIEVPFLQCSFRVPSNARRILGRDSEADFFIECDPTLSRMHCKFETSGPKAFVCNLSRTNGMLVNGKRIRDTQSLFDGDLISAGSLILVIRILDHGIE